MDYSIFCGTIGLTYLRWEFGIPPGLVAILVILQAVGFDDQAIVTGVGMIYVVDRILDMSRTMINVLGTVLLPLLVRANETALSKFQFFKGVKFQLQADYSPQGDQPEAISKLIDSVHAGNNYQTLLGGPVPENIYQGT